MKKTIFFLILLVTVGVFCPAKILAGFGVSPAIILNPYLKPGSHYEKEITLSRSEANETLEVLIEPELKEMQDWVEFVPGEKVVFPKGEQKLKVKAVFDIPESAPYKSYDGIIRVKAYSLGKKAEGGVSVVMGARMEVKLITTKMDVFDLLVRAIKAKEENVEAGKPLAITFLIENKGNKEVAPEIKGEVFTLNNKPVEKLEPDPVEAISAYETKEVEAVFYPTVGKGEYFLQIGVYLSGNLLREEKVFFRVLGTAAKPEQIKKPAVEEQLQELVSLPMMAGGLIIFIMGGLLATAIRSKNKKFKITLLLLVGGVFLVSLTVGLTVYIMSRNQPPRPPMENIVDEYTDTVSLEQPEPMIAGIETEIIEKEDFPLVIEGGKETSYGVYKKPDLASSVIYSATEDEKFWVIEEIVGWYKIQLPVGIEGWLPKTSVKEAK